LKVAVVRSEKLVAEAGDILELRRGTFAVGSHYKTTAEKT
jgi:hypothetical protein